MKRNSLQAVQGRRRGVVMKKVCMLLINPVTNDQRVRREAGTLVKAGYRVVVIGVSVTGESRDEWFDGPEGYQVRRVLHPKAILRRRLRAVPGSGPSDSPRPAGLVSRLFADLLNIAGVLWMNLALTREAIRQHADVYHAHDLDTLPAGYLAKLWTRKKLVYDFHELFTELYRRGVKSGFWRLFFSAQERFLAKRADLRLTVCDSLGEWMTRQYGINGVVTVMNAPQKEVVSPVPAGGRREKVILYHGAFLPDRGLEPLIESARYLEGARIVLRGVGLLEEPLRRLVQAIGVEEKVSFAPPVPVTDLVKAASAADIGMIPYLPACDNLRLCLPNKLFEYIMAGLAVVATDLPEIRRIILHHNLGVVLDDPNDARSIARTLNALLKDEGRLEAMKRNALEVAQSLYNWECESAKLLRAYDGMAQRGE